ncbi:helix-turn-helix domain-containing protein [Hypericibacter sp.]|uniref:helix-turn-helix domain-containing protein n=1 Tax=Hypericibacter sp. TaxID=2705401 RepID=UPI003D6C83C6
MGRKSGASGGDGPQQAYGDHLAERFWLEKPKSHVARSFKRGPLAVTQIKSDFPTPEPSQSIGYDEAWLIGLMVDNVPDHELWQDGRSARTPPFRSGETALYDLRRDPISFTRTGHHSLHFYLPRALLGELAEQNALRFDGELRYRFATGYDDPVIRHLGAALLPALEGGGPLSGLFLDHILYAVAAHVLGRYGEAGSQGRRSARGGLSPQQLRRAQSLMLGHLGSDISLSRLAAECGLSVTHFSRAFRQSTGITPHRWLQARRIDMAMTLLRLGERTLPEIAIDCGFADQSHFTKVFCKHTGVSPGRWRRQSE